MMRRMFIMIAPFVVIVLVMPFVPILTQILPNFAMPQCGTKKFAERYPFDMSLAVIFYVMFDAVYNVVFLTMMFLTRKVRDEFTINREFKTMIILRFFVNVAYLGSVVFWP